MRHQTKIIIREVKLCHHMVQYLRRVKLDL